MDDQIYEAFRERFKDYDVKLLKEDDLKSDKAKEVSVNMSILLPFQPHIMACFSEPFHCWGSQTWRTFCNQFEGVVEDFNYGTLLRLDCERDYTEENSIFGTFASLQMGF